MLSDGMGVGQEPLRSGSLSGCMVGEFLSGNTCAENAQSDVFIVGQDGKGYDSNMKKHAPCDV